MKKSRLIKLLIVPALLLASFSFSSCAVYSVTSTAVGATTTAVKTTGKAVKTTGKVATGVGKAVIPDGEDNDKD